MKKITHVRRVSTLLIAVVFTAMAYVPVSVPRAHADISAHELINLLVALHIIPADKAALARSAVAGQAGNVPPVCPYQWTRNLTVGAAGPDVLALQKYLNADTATRIASAGAGSPGMETQLFGPLTSDAVRRFQVKYASEILRPIGLTQGTGFVGASTRAKFNVLCRTASVPTPAPTPPVVQKPPVTSAPVPTAPIARAQEANLTRYRLLNTPSSVDVEEGVASDVMAAQFEVKDAAVTLSRADVLVQAVGTINERRPWNLLQTLALYDGSTKIASLTVDTKGAWSELGDNTYRARFTNINRTYAKGTKPILTVRAEVRRVVDSQDVPQDLALWIPERGLRLRDGAGVEHYLGSNTDKEMLIVQKAGRNEELTIRQSGSNPDETMFPVGNTKVSEEHTLLAFEIEAEDHEIAVNELPVTVYTYDDQSGSVSFDSVVERIWLVIGGVVYDDVLREQSVSSVVDGVPVTVTTVTFDLHDNALVMGKDTKTGGQVQVTFRKLSGNYSEGQRVSVAMTQDNIAAIVAEGADTIPTDRLSGRAHGAIHVLRTEGVVLTGGTLSAAGRGDTLTRGEYSVTFIVRAFNNDLYIPIGALWVDAEGMPVSGSSDAGARYFLVAANSTATGTARAILTSRATRVGDAYRVREGTSETFTLIVNTDPSVTDFYRVILDGVGFRTAAQINADAVYELARPESQFATEYVYLQG